MSRKPIKLDNIPSCGFPNVQPLRKTEVKDHDNEVVTIQGFMIEAWEYRITVRQYPNWRVEMDVPGYVRENGVFVTKKFSGTITPTGTILNEISGGMNRIILNKDFTDGHYLGLTKLKIEIQLQGELDLPTAEVRKLRPTLPKKRRATLHKTARKKLA